MLAVWVRADVARGFAFDGGVVGGRNIVVFGFFGTYKFGRQGRKVAHNLFKRIAMSKKETFLAVKKESGC
jgi:hypothetical protein